MSAGFSAWKNSTLSILHGRCEKTDRVAIKARDAFFPFEWKSTVCSGVLYILFRVKRRINAQRKNVHFGAQTHTNKNCNVK